MKRILIALLVLVISFSLFAAGQQEAAKADGGSTGKKGSVMVYTSTGEDVVLKLKEAFEAKYPNITMDYYYGGSGKVVTKLSTEFQTKAVTCDLVWMADPSSMITWKGEGNLVPYKSPNAEAIDAKFKDSEDYFTAARMVIMGIGFSTTATSDAEAPYTFRDMLNPKWKGQIVMADPSNAGTTKACVYALVNDPGYGWKFFEDFKANGGELESSSGNTVNKVAAAAYQLCIGVDYNCRNMAENGSAIGFHNTTDVVCACPCPIAITKGAPNEENAKILYDWLLDPEGGQKVLANDCNMTVTNPKTSIPAGMIRADEAARVAMPIDWIDMKVNGKAMLEKFDALFK
ncbi:MAG: ABC transporter substrate-binding protein [Sphaerochaetaceae bacterium]|nr:ABC transporter substrate-binding protein [Sphaerochaetaceae bacterium]